MFNRNYRVREGKSNDLGFEIPQSEIRNQCPRILHKMDI